MALITVTNLTFSYEGAVLPVFEDLNLQLDTNWKLGVVGRNGRGKTTLLGLLEGRLQGKGTISCPEPCRCVPQPVLDPTLPTGTVLEELSQGEESWRLRRELSLLGLEETVLERPFQSLSGGEQTRALLAALFLGQGNYLMLDEPTNHLDGPGRQMVARYLSRLKRGFLLVSHDRDFLDGCVDHILALNKTGPEIVRGDCSSWLREKQARDQGELARNQELRGEIRRLEQAVRRTGDWSERVERTKYGSKNSGLRPDRGYVGHKAAKLMKRSKNLESRQKQAIEEKQGLLRDVERYDALKLVTAPGLRSRYLLQARDVSIALGGKPVLQSVNFEMGPGERVCLAGGNGGGKTSLLRLLLGEAEPCTGTIQQASGLEISYMPQNTGFLQGNLMEWAGAQGIEVPLMLGVLRKLDFPRELFSVDMACYSDGQKKKLLLAASLSRRAHLYVWDEPLNYIDLYARMQLEELIVREQPTLLFVEHDQAFCRAVATRTVNL